MITEIEANKLAMEYANNEFPIWNNGRSGYYSTARDAYIAGMLKCKELYEVEKQNNDEQ